MLNNFTDLKTRTKYLLRFSLQLYRRHLLPIKICLIIPYNLFPFFWQPGDTLERTMLSWLRPIFNNQKALCLRNKLGAEELSIRTLTVCPLQLLQRVAECYFTRGKFFLRLIYSNQTKKNIYKILLLYKRYISIETFLRWTTPKRSSDMSLEQII